MFADSVAGSLEGAMLGRGPMAAYELRAFRMSAYENAMRNIIESYGTNSATSEFAMGNYARNFLLTGEALAPANITYEGLQIERLSIEAAERAELANWRATTLNEIEQWGPRRTAARVAEYEAAAREQLGVEVEAKQPVLQPWVVENGEQGIDQEEVKSLIRGAVWDNMAASLTNNFDRFVQTMRQAGISLNGARQAAMTAWRNYGVDAGRAVVSRWIANRLALAAGGAAGFFAGTAAKYILDQNPGETNTKDRHFVLEQTGVGTLFQTAANVARSLVHLPPMSVDAKREAANNSITGAKILSKIVDREIMEAYNTVMSTGLSESIAANRTLREHAASYANSLQGSVTRLADTYSPFGAIDRLLPKSSPTYQPVSFDHYGNRAGFAIFTSPLEGDFLSERSSDPAARSLRTMIPRAPEVVSHAENPFVATAQPRDPAGVLDYFPPAGSQKRKAEEPLHSNRTLEGLVSQNYDPTFVPSLPSSMTAPTSGVWREYTADKTATSVPLADARNIVGIGYDAEQTERKLAQESGGDASTRSVTPSVPPPESEAGRDVNAANQTNPAYKDIGKAQVNITPTETPVRDLGIHH